MFRTKRWLMLISVTMILVLVATACGAPAPPPPAAETPAPGETPAPTTPPAEETPGTYRYRGAVRLKMGETRETLGRFHRELVQRVSRPIRVPLIFRLGHPFDRSVRGERRDAPSQVV